MAAGFEPAISASRVGGANHYATPHSQYLSFIFSERNLNFQLKFKVVLSWLDHRLVYKNLKEETKENLILTSVAEKIWVPPLIFKNSDTRPTTTFKDDGSVAIVAVKNSTGSPGPMHLNFESQVFSGAENPLKMMARYFTTFDCYYNLTWYPFDKQTCSANVRLKKLLLVSSRPYEQ